MFRRTLDGVEWECESQELISNCKWTFSSIHWRRCASIFLPLLAASCNESLKSESTVTKNCCDVTDDTVSSLGGESYSHSNWIWKKFISFPFLFSFQQASSHLSCVVSTYVTQHGEDDRNSAIVTVIGMAQILSLICYWRTNVVVKFNLFQSINWEQRTGSSRKNFPFTIHLIS